MADQSRDASVNENDDGVRRAEDLFRRAAFGWALSTKRLVETSVAVGPNTRVAHAALADIEHARNMLNGLFVPKVLKAPTAGREGEVSSLTAESVRESVSSLVERIATAGAPEVVHKSHVAYTPRVDPTTRKAHRSAADFSAPVHPKNGKMLWAGVDCPACPSKATQRCQKPDGGFMEKPHKERTDVLFIK